MIHAILSPSDLIGGRYRVIRLVKVGAMGAIYQVRDQRLNKEWAAKLLHLGHLSQPDQQEMIGFFDREAEILSKLRHPAIPFIADYFSEGQSYCIVMDFIDGQSLQELIEEKRTARQPFSLDEVIDLGTQLCQVVEVLHSQTPPIIYRDMKPSNVMRTKSGRVILVDFGISGWLRQAPPTAQTQSGTSRFGSPGYAAPEQYTSNLPIDQRTDVYGIGATLHELLTGIDPSTRPFMFEPVRKYRPDIGQALENAILKAVSGAQDERFQTVASLREAMARPPIGAPASPLRPATAFQPDPALQQRLDNLPLPRPCFQQFWWSLGFRAGDNPGQCRRRATLARLQNYYRQGLLDDAFREAASLVADIDRCKYDDERALRDECWFILGQLYEAKADLLAAQDCYERSIRYDETFDPAYQALAAVKARITHERAVRQQRAVQAAQARRSRLAGWLDAQWHPRHLRQLFLLDDHFGALMGSWILGLSLGFILHGHEASWDVWGILGTALAALILSAGILFTCQIVSNWAGYCSTNDRGGEIAENIVELIAQPSRDRG